MSGVLQDLSTPTLAAAVEENGCDFFRLFRHWPRAEVHDGPDVVWTLTSIPFSVFNSVAGARLEPHAVDAAIEATIARCRSRGVPMLWTTGPSTRPANLGTYLQAHGFVTGGDRPGMAADLLALDEGLPAPPGLVIERVRDLATLRHWCRVFNAGFGMPDYAEAAWFDLFANTSRDPQSPLRHYIGRLGGTPVATASLLLRAGVSGIYSVTALPEARRQGIGAEMTLTALRDARALGYRVGVLSATEAGSGIYGRMGFRECCRIGSYVWTGAE